MPTEYFETKFKRVVNVDEFSHAVVPENTSSNVIDLLKKKNIDVIKYGKNGQAEALKKLTIEKGLMFGLGIIFVSSNIKDNISDQNKT